MVARPRHDGSAARFAPLWQGRNLSDAIALATVDDIKRPLRMQWNALAPQISLRLKSKHCVLKNKPPNAKPASRIGSRYGVSRRIGRKAFEHSERRRQQFAALAVRRLDDSDQQPSCCPLVTRRLHCGVQEAAADRAAAAPARTPAPIHCSLSGEQLQLTDAEIDALFSGSMAALALTRMLAPRRSRRISSSHQVVSRVRISRVSCAIFGTSFSCARDAGSDDFCRFKA